MIDFNFNFPSASTTRQRLAKGYRARRNYLIFDLFSMIVDHTPVKTGLARGNWRITIGAAATGTLKRLDPDGHDTVIAEISHLKGASPFATIHLGNNLEYIGELEDGSSSQAPQGIVRVVMPAFRLMHRDVE